MTTAVVASLLHYLGVVSLPSMVKEHIHGDENSTELDIVHAIAQTAHCIAQGKVGSGFDVSSAVYGSQRYVRFSPEMISSAQSAGKGLSIQDTIDNVLKSNWDHERIKFSLPPLMTLLLGEPGAGGSSTPSMVGAVKKWQKSDPKNSPATWMKEENSALEMHLNTLSQLPQKTYDAYRMVINHCSLITSAEIEPESQTQLLDTAMNMEGVLLTGVPGAGGLDAVFAVTLGDSSQNVIKTWISLNILALLVREDPHGVYLETNDPRVT